MRTLFRLLRNAGKILDLVRKVADAAQDKQLTEDEVRGIMEEAIPLARRLGLLN